jgi:hypothetical protein
LSAWLTSIVNFISFQPSTRQLVLATPPPLRQGCRKDTLASQTSLAAYLAEPYIAPRSRLEATARDAVQCAEGELYGHGGWTLDWNTVDWLIAAGAFAYDAETPITAIKRIADAVGAVIQSHPSEKVLTVQPRYKESSWHLATATPDVIIPGDIIAADGPVAPCPTHSWGVSVRP